MKLPHNLVIGIALLLVLTGGVALLERAEAQARDTTRKHHIEDIENSLYFARSINGSIPPYEENSWCGVLNDPANRHVRDQVEVTLRAQHEKYANPDKPFPFDPLFEGTAKDYFYWKHSPSSFELYAVLEEDPNGERATHRCEQGTVAYDYGVSSTQRESDSFADTIAAPI